MKKCFWVDPKSEIYNKYHDEEWGVPVYDDQTLYEMLILECFQAGLSWITILNKREFFRKAYDNFNAEKIAMYDENKILNLLENKDIIRHRKKIEASINNTKVFLKIQNDYGTFSKYLWGFTNNEIIYRKTEENFTKTELSDRVSSDLKKKGMKFVGSVTIYSYLQAIGIVNDHQLDCFKRKEIENEV